MLPERALPGAPVVVPSAASPLPGAEPAAQTPTRAPSVERIPCQFPPVRGVPEFTAKLDPNLKVAPTGGRITPGKYRLTGARSRDPDHAGGLWTMLLDLASDGQGAFYRRAGLRRLSSRITWQTEGDEFSWVTVCPDLEPSGMSFLFSAEDAGLVLVTKEGVVLRFERFEDSRVEGMPPPQKLPAHKIHLPE